eukprot:CAMPEP_0185850498 /NCGR_PEP_ID=MMETSP1354-20130828/4611_1 /TAXON_ID=708628 /ORGANISM="Erythrolobus madagascarensis, Strain CCMP3276" /LENGTH=402 /DNA_ID=CAMNT_0028551185 /DNA_START=63 /DNA_END=1271 /DNA_ORIENTATION=-
MAAGEQRYVYKWRAPHALYAVGWSFRDCSARMMGSRLAVGSFVDTGAPNSVTVLHAPLARNQPVCARCAQQGLVSSSTPRTTDGKINSTRCQCVRVLTSLPHMFPPSKIGWIPDIVGEHPDLLASSSDALRLWRFDDNDQGKLVCTLSPDSTAAGGGIRNAPLTAFDWSEVDVSTVATCAIDTTCTVWDVGAQAVHAQIIAHDKEVYDVALAPRDASNFATVGADGSVRLFDLRALEHSTIVYESTTPLLRLKWNRFHPNVLAALALGGDAVLMLDLRMPGSALAMLETSRQGQTGTPDDMLNALAWAPHSDAHVIAGGERGLAYVWDVSDVANTKDAPRAGAATGFPSTTTRGGALGRRRGAVEPALVYDARRPVDNLAWSPTDPNWVSVVGSEELQLVRV